MKQAENQNKQPNPNSLDYTSPEEEKAAEKSLFWIPRRPQDPYTMKCPSCFKLLSVTREQLNCKIFRCGIWKKSFWIRDGKPPFLPSKMFDLSPFYFSVISMSTYSLLVAPNKGFHEDILPDLDKKDQKKEEKNELFLKDVEQRQNESKMIQRYQLVSPDYSAEEKNQLYRMGWINLQFSEIDPHSSKKNIEEWLKHDLIAGCGCPFRFDGVSPPQKCGYL